jgi:hypothetical protein
MRKLFTLLFYLNLLALVLAVAQMFMLWFNIGEDLFSIIIQIRLYLTFPILASWIWSIVICFQRDKSARIFALFFLAGFYTLFYYKRVMKNNWIN